MDFPKIELSGGPMARNVELKVNGEKVSAVTGITIYADVHDVIRVETRQISEIASVDIYGVLEKAEVVKAQLRIHVPEDDGYDNWITVDGEGASLREAVQNAVDAAERAKLGA